MDRNIVYPGQIPLETDLLGTNQRAMVAIGKLSGAIFGTGGVVNGLTVAPNTPAALNIVVSPGEIYQLQNLEATAYSSLPADTTHSCVKQGILLDAVTLACPAPPTAGFSTNYLIEAAYVENDVAATTLPYYNASNPSQAYSGPNNSGAQQATVRAGQLQLQVKSGVAAATGTQVTPATDTGYIALAVVTVANGQTTVTSASIVAANGAQLVRNAVTSGRLLNVQTFSTPGTFTYRKYPGASSARVTVVGGGAGAGSAAANSASQASAGSGGSGGGAAQSFLTGGIDGALVTVGAGGLGGAAGGQNNGTNGGTSSFGSFLSATGGGAGGAFQGAATILTGPGAPGVGSGGNIFNASGGSGSVCFSTSLSFIFAGVGGGSLLAGPSRQVAAGGSGNSSPGGNGFGPGAGGGGAVSASSGASQAGGNGAAGIVIVEEFA